MPNTGNDSTSVARKHGNSKLQFAAKTGQATLVYSLVQDKGMDVNYSNIHKETPLHSAAAGKDKEAALQIIQYLLDHGANPYAKDKDNDTFLHVYVMQCKAPSPAQFHLMAGCLVQRNLVDLFSYPGGLTGATPLQLAVGYLELEQKTLGLLHSHDLNVNFPDNDGDCVLAYAVYGKRSITFLSYIINQLGADPNHLNTKGDGLLQIAAKSGSAATLKYFTNLAPTLNQALCWNALLHLAVDPDGRQIDVIEKCKFLIGKGAKKNSKTKTQEQSALHLAAVGRNLKVIKWLIQNGAYPYAKDMHKYTFLQQYFRREVTPTTPSQFHLLAEFLIGKKGFYKLFNLKSGDDGATPVQLALLTLEVEERTLTLLSSNKVNFKLVDDHGDNLLAYAVAGRRSIKLLSILIEKFKVNWRRQNKLKNTILHHAAEHSNYETLKFFLDMGFLDVDGVDLEGDTPLSCAVAVAGAVYKMEEGELWKKCKLLIEKGANIDNVNKEGDTPLEILRKEYDGKDKEQLEKLLSHNENDNMIG